MDKRAHVIFKGRVQGVFFRANTMQKARRTGAVGWVRNLPDGSVESVLEGEEEIVNEVIEWCSKSQPHAVVDDVQVEWTEATGEFEDFSILH